MVDRHKRLVLVALVHRLVDLAELLQKIGVVVRHWHAEGQRALAGAEPVLGGIEAHARPLEPARAVLPAQHAYVQRPMGIRTRRVVLPDLAEHRVKAGPVELLVRRLQLGPADANGGSVQPGHLVECTDHLRRPLALVKQDDAFHVRTCGQDVGSVPLDHIVQSVHIPPRGQSCSRRNRDEGSSQQRQTRPDSQHARHPVHLLQKAASTEGLH